MWLSEPWRRTRTLRRLWSHAMGSGVGSPQETLDTNLFGGFGVARVFLLYMRSQNVGTISGSGPSRATGG